MFRNTLVAAALLSASISAMAGHDGHAYGRVISVEPHFVISFGGGQHLDGFRIRYEMGGNYFWTHSHHRPGHVIWMPRPAEPVAHHYRPHPHWNHDRHGDWDGRRDRHQDKRYGKWRDRDHDRY